MNSAFDAYSPHPYGAANYILPYAFSASGIAPHLRDNHYEDAVQVAAAKFWQMHGQNKKYAFTAARRAVIQWIQEYIYEDRSHRNDGNYIRVFHCQISPTQSMPTGNPEDMLIAREERMEREELLDEAADIILEIMMSARTQKRGRAVKAAVRDANIILLALQGYSTHGIAHELGEDLRNVQSYLRNARQILEDYLVSVS